ncbi:MAG: hypothetical protein AAFR73_11310 [Pseudomonadota bacterium]
MIRAELHAFLDHWKEALSFGAACVGAMSVVIFVPQPSLQILSALGACGFGTLSFLAWRRTALQQSVDGPGVVEMSEREITFFGPAEGWTISLDDLAEVAIASDEAEGNAVQYHWIFRTRDGGYQTVPTSALGADQLVTGVSFLDGLDISKASHVIRSGQQGVFVIWQKVKDRPLHLPNRSV